MAVRIRALRAIGVAMHSPASNPPSREHEWPASWFEAVDTCLLCGSNDCQQVLDKVQDWFFRAVPGDFSYAKCRECGSLLLENRPDAQHIGDAYRNYYTHAEIPGEREKVELLRSVWRSLAGGYSRFSFAQSRKLQDRVSAALVRVLPRRRSMIDAMHRHVTGPNKTVLDYGCGNGTFLNLAKSLGNRVVGVDFDPQAVQIARARGTTVYLPSEVPDEQFAEQFDMITAAHVIEHVPDPAVLLRDFRRWLKPDGVLFIEVPNAEAAGVSHHGRFWRGLEAPRHFSIPSERGLATALRNAGLEPIEMRERTLSRAFIDLASSDAAKANPAFDAGASRIDGLSGPEIFVCLARRY